MRGFMKKLLLGILVISTIMTSCNLRNSSKTSFLNLKAGKYFSMLQQTETIYFGLIQLSLPALLKEAKLVDGVPVIDENLKAAIVAQQKEVIAKIQAISPDIKIITSYKLVLNALSFAAPSSLVDQIEGIEGISKIIENTNFERPHTLNNEQNISEVITS